MSTGSSSPSGSSSTTQNMHWLDWLMLVILCLAVVAYGTWLAYLDYQDLYVVRWAAFIVFIVVGSACFVGGYVLVRATDSKPGHWSATEFFGVLLCVVGSILFLKGALPQVVDRTLEEMARPIQALPDADPPLLRTDPLRRPTGDFVTLQVDRVGGGADKVRVLLELDPGATEVVIPADSHGKVWYTLPNGRSLASEF